MSNFNAPQYDPRMLHYIFTFLLMGQVALALIVLYLVNNEGAIVAFNIADIPTFSLPIMVFSTNFIARKLFQQQFNKISQIDDIAKKMSVIQLAHVIEWAMVEGGTLLLLVFAQTEGNLYFMLLAAVNIIYFFSLKPKILLFNQDF